jgi:hypothetical protein
MAATADEFQAAADRIQDLALGGDSGTGRNTRGRRDGGRGGRGGRGGGGGGGGNRQVLISKALSTVLRHQAQSAGIVLDVEGFAALDKVVGSLLFLFLHVTRELPLSHALPHCAIYENFCYRASQRLFTCG